MVVIKVISYIYLVVILNGTPRVFGIFEDYETCSFYSDSYTKQYKKKNIQISAECLLMDKQQLQNYMETPEIKL